MSTNKDYPREQRPEKDCGCHDNADNPTQQSLDRERAELCTILYDTAAKVKMLEKKFQGENSVYSDKKCLFNKTQTNYQLYRNMEITVGTELLQTSESVKANVTAYNKWNKDLNTVLKGITKSMKDVKTKFSDLKDAACKLDSCRKDKCNATQVMVLTGEKPESCKDEDDPRIPDECKEAKTILDELVCLPKGMMQDIDSIFMSSADVVGIQVFSNIETLDLLQKTLDERSKKFEKHISDIMTLREGDLKKLKDDLVKSVKEITRVAMERNSTRSEFEGYKDAVTETCCLECDCLKNGREDRPKEYQKQSCDELCEPRLEKCEQEICDVCDEVKKAFCCDSEGGQETEAKPQQKQYQSAR